MVGFGLAASLAMTAYAVPAPPSDAAAAAFRAAIERSGATLAAAQDITWTLHQRVYADGALRPPEVMIVKFRPEYDVYVRWIAGTVVGRELLFVPAQNGGLMRVKVSDFLPSLDLDPHGALAMRGQRHPIHRMSPLETHRVFVDDAAAIDAHPTALPKVTDLGERTIYGDKARCFLSDLPKDAIPTLYGYRVEACFAALHGLPIRIQVWDHVGGSLRIVEDYHNEKMRVNVGLTDLDFSFNHPDYGF